MVKIHYFAVMVKPLVFFYKYQVKYLRKAFTEEKKLLCNSCLPTAFVPLSVVSI